MDSRHDLGFAPGILGTIWAVGGISSLFGAVAAEPANRRIGIGPAMIVGLFLYRLAMFLAPLAQGATLIGALLLILQQIPSDGAATSTRSTRSAWRQAITPERLLGRVNASMEFLRLGATLASSLLGGLLGEGIGVRATLFLGAIGTLLSTLWLLLSPLRALRAAPVVIVEPLR